MIAVIIPAHNESSVVGRLLHGLLADAKTDELAILVIANGCTDDTARVAETLDNRIRVISTPIASKSHALRIGAANAPGFPRLYVDADVVLRTADVRALADALRAPEVLAVAPGRTLVLADRPLLVRWYYTIWQLLPSVQNGLFGRGVIAVGEEGQRRLDAAPTAMSDDLAASVSFAPGERRIVPDAQVVVHPPRTVGDLLRRRVRTLTGTVQLQGAMAGVDAARTRRADLVHIVRTRPSLAPHMVVFLAITLIARWRARRPIRSGDYTTWLRDESSRTPVKE